MDKQIGRAPLARRRFLVGLAGLASAPLLPLRGSAQSSGDSTLVEARLVARAATSQLAQSGEMLVHVHGLAYSADGKKLMVPSHEGLAIYERGKWSKAPGLRHDYMGFASTRQYLYASGHPAPGSGVANPFGLIRSRDGGRSWDKLGLEGEISFLLLAAGLTTNVLYVWNPQPNSRMKGFGVHYTLDEGQSWHAAAGVGLDGEPRALAAHPYAAGTVAIGTTEGVFLSRDFGGRFEGLARDVQGLALQFDLDGERLRGEDRPKAKELGLALHFDLDGERLWLGSFAGTAYLARIDLRSGTIEPAPTPHWGQDPVSYIAQNPASRTEYAIATLGRSVYLSKNGARTWTQIADRGRVR